jgi:MoxR-like ATPase
MIQFLDATRGMQVALPAFAGLPPCVHLFDEDSVFAVNAALAGERPLLVRGEPGTGKTQLARAAAAALGRGFLSRTIDSRTESRDLFWTFDAVARLAEAQVQGVLGVRDSEVLRRQLDERRFLRPGPLWWAFDWHGASQQAECAGIEPPPVPERWSPRNGCVVLLDEIDKADSSVPNGLLEALAMGRFEAPSYPAGVSLSLELPRPLVVATTNEERALPDAFLRRCFVLHLSLPRETSELEGFLVERGRAHFPELEESSLERAASLLAGDRAEVLRRGLAPPGQAEFLDLLRAVSSACPRDAERQRDLLDRIARFALKKHPEEQSP